MMDKRTLRLRKGKSRNVRPYDRQNQSIFGKVCSTVKGLLNPSWLFNVSHWIGNSEEQQGGSSDNVEDENGNINRNEDVVSQSVSNASKRLRLRLDGHNNYQDGGPSIQNSETQTWPDQLSQNLYESISRVVPPSSSTTQSSLLENKEVMAVMNGDDHSENSEGSASTSGCSSLISSHMENNRLAERPFVSLLDIKNTRKRKETSPKAEYNDLNSSRGLWSSSISPSLKFQRRYQTVSTTNQPNFNLSSFAGPSRVSLSESSDKKTSSPFYEGKTTFGGASASRRMPSSVTPYQVDRSLRNQIRVREHNSEDNLKRMSSAAERILMTLDKISSPVSDAKRIPNLDTSPVDLSVYLTPPKSRWNSQFTPPIVSKGPPIANINTIAKLATLKNFGTSRLRSTQSSSATPVEEKSSNLDFLQPSVPETLSQKSGGGKMKNKLNQHHISSKGGIPENEVMDTPVLKNIPLPITSLPTISFGPKSDKTMNTQLPAPSFTFSKPIEHDLSITSAVPTSTLPLHLPYDSFKFANPIDYDVPNNTKPKENLPSPTWECSACWVRNPQSRTSCLACETPRENKEIKSTMPSNSPMFSSFKSSSTQNGIFKFGNQPLEKPATNSTSTAGFKFGKAEVTVQSPSTSSPDIISSTIVTASGTNNLQAESWECSECWIKNPKEKSKCLACEAPQPAKTNKPEVDTSTNAGNTSTNNVSSTWECTSCWVRNPIKEKKCMACETLHPNADINSGLKDSGFKFSSPLQNSPITFKFGNYVCTAPSTVTTSSFKFGLSVTESQASTTTAVTTMTTATTATGFKFDTSSNTNTFISPVVSSASDVLSVTNKSEENKVVSTTSTTSVTTSSQFVFGSAVTTSTPSSSSLAPLAVTTPSFKFGASVTESQTSSTTFTTPSSTTTTGFKFETIPNTNTFVSSITASSASDTHPLNTKTEENKVVTSTSTLSITTSSPFVFGSVVTTSAQPSLGAPTSVATSSFKFGLSATEPQTSTTTTTSSSTGFKFDATSNANTFINPLVTSVSSTNPDIIKTVESKVVSSTSVPSVTTSSPFVFGSIVATSAPPAFSFFASSSSGAATVTTTTSNATTTAPVFTFGSSSNQSGGFTFKGLEKPQTTAAVSLATQSVTPSLSTGSSTQVPFQHPIFGASKSEAPNVIPATPVTFTFGTGSTTVSSNTSAFSAFQPSQPGNTNFQFGSQMSGSTAPTIGTSNFAFSKTEDPNPTSSAVSQNTASAFGSTVTNFVFGTKNENASSSAVSQPSGLAFGSSPSFTFSNKNDNSDAASQKPPLPFGSSTVPTIPVFGNNPGQPSFDGPDKKPASGGFNFGAPSSAVFQFGATDKKRPAAASGFSFGTPAAASDTNNSFPTGFSVNTPPSFNFGTTSTPAGPFQFAASTAAKPVTAANSGQRKIRKAVRRVTRGRE